MFANWNVVKPSWLRITRLELFLLIVIAAALAALLAGCSTVRPPQLTDYSDAGALAYSNAVLASWDTTNNDYLSYGGAVSAAGLSTGTLLAAGTGSPAVTGLAFGAALLQWVRSIFQPTDRANALDEGAEMVRDALKKYFAALTSSGIKNVPANCLTVQAGTLIGDVEDAQNVVSRLDKKRRPPDPKPPDSQRIAAGGTNDCGRR